MFYYYFFTENFTTRQPWPNSNRQVEEYPQSPTLEEIASIGTGRTNKMFTKGPKAISSIPSNKKEWSIN